MVRSAYVPSFWRIGGIAKDLNTDFTNDCQAFLQEFPKTLKDLENLLTDNYIWYERLRGIAVIDEETCKQYACTGPVLRGAGVPYDIRRAYPYLGYENYQFEIPTQTEGDAYARYLVRIAELHQSLSIIDQALSKLTPGPIITEDRKVALPPRHELARSMEAVIHQFKLVSEGIHPPIGEVYNCVESARGEIGHYVVSDGSNRPYRIRVRSPSFQHVHVLQKILPGYLLSDVVVAIASVDPILGDVDR